MQPVPINYNTFAFIINREGLFGKNNLPAQRGQMVIFENDGNQVVVKKRIESEDANTGKFKDLDLLLIAGLPLNEPVVRYGPFVMNEQSEIYQAIEDYRSGKMGKIDFEH